MRDSFSLGERLESIHRQFSAGLVIRLFCDFTITPKEKLLLIVSATCDPPLFFFNNSKKAPHSAFDKTVDTHQIPLTQVQNDFLSHDSFVDCSVTHDNFSLANIEKALAADMSRLLGRINKNTAITILEVLAESDLLSRVHVNQISTEIV